MSDFNPTYLRVFNEDCNLNAWHTPKTGPLILFIPGGNGHGRQYNPIMKHLQATYTTATYDRRQMSDSLVENPHIMTYAQQARDSVAVIKAIGFEKAIVFGSSAGGTYALQVAIDFPEIVDVLITHEAAAPQYLPDKEEMYHFFRDCVEVFKKEGMDKVREKTVPTFIGMDDEGVPKSVSPEPWNAINQWTYEIPAMIEEDLDLTKIRENGVVVGLLVGKRSKNAWYARNAYSIQEVLGCELMVVPGHHLGFEVETEAVLPFFLKMLETLKRQKAAK